MLPGGELSWGDIGKLRTAIAKLRTDCSCAYGSLVQVTSGGDVQKSDLAGRVKIKLVDGTTKTRVVPASQVEAQDGKLWIPRWLAIEKTDSKNFAGAVRLPELAEVGLRKIEENLDLQIQLLTKAAEPFQAAERIEAPLRAVRQEQERLQQERKRVAEQAERIKLIEKAGAQKAKRAAQILALPIYAENVTVKGRDWETKKGNFVVTEWEIEKATVRVSGTRAYIFEEGKTPFWKPLDKITIVASSVAATHSAASGTAHRPSPKESALSPSYSTTPATKSSAT